MTKNIKNMFKKIVKAVKSTTIIKKNNIFKNESILKNEKISKNEKKSKNNNFPVILHSMQKYLKSNNIKCNKSNEDGRINSCLDEDKIIHLLSKKYENKIIRPKIRMWYDILVNDRKYGWIPVNIKSTTMDTNDNTGNFAMCVYGYTDEKLDLNKSYKNGEMSKLLIEKIRAKKYNTSVGKDYYFLVMNKNNPKDIIVNSVRGLTNLVANNNNLPFQICWKNNRKYNYSNNIENKIETLMNCFKKPKMSWIETFLSTIRNLQ